MSFATFSYNISPKGFGHSPFEVICGRGPCLMSDYENENAEEKQNNISETEDLMIERMKVIRDKMVQELKNIRKKRFQT
ncbi:hypothetical protein H312_01531 [Anncaliia algerae PRA339]|uniref:Uncharacterized protein n=1 Tax=Anncaliia algerae PRA339 TaxID=1288291 RepID=A0A059F1M9_9MICR|nr:hypothetical protein H312_01531 [Anncaliia algerae PRA339]